MRVFSIGEGQGDEMFDYGWIEDDKGSRVWEMQGNYKLRYKTDDSHAFDHWNSLPPDINCLGIAVYKK